MQIKGLNLWEIAPKFDWEGFVKTISMKGISNWSIVENLNTGLLDVLFVWCESSYLCY